MFAPFWAAANSIANQSHDLHVNLMLRVSLRQIAEKAGVSAMTVSLALRDHPRISSQTRARIKSLASEMDYRPDPALAALLAYRQERQIVRNYGTIAFLTNFPSVDGWRSQVFINRYYDGAVQRARELGYVIDTIWMSQPGMTPRRMVQILAARGIKGLLVAPIPASAAVLALDWDEFCAVSLCKNLIKPEVNVVDHNHHQSMTLAWHEVRRRGYRRVGYAIRDYAENITGRRWVAAYLMEQRHPSRSKREANLEPLVTDRWTKSVFTHWVHKVRPDVIISPDLSVYTWLQEMSQGKTRAPDFLWLEAETTRDISGVTQHFDQVGIAAVDVLHMELLRNAYGVPLSRHTLEIDGSWIEGRTLRPA